MRRLSVEIIILIAEALSSPSDLSSLARTSRYFAHLLEPTLLRVAASHKYPDLSTVLSREVRRGRFNRVEALLEHGADLSQGKPLLEAATWGHYSITSLLISRGADVNASNHRGWTALTMATFKGHEAVAKLLLEHGSDVNTTEFETHRTPLHEAAENSHEKLAELLVGAGADVSAVANCHPLCNEYNQDACSCVGETFDEDMTPLDHAARQGSAPIVQLLLGADASVNRRSCFGRNALYHAGKGGHAAVVEMLLGAGVELEVHDNTGKTPLHFAAEHGSAAAVSVLTDAGANLEAQDRRMRSPLHCAVCALNEFTVAVLINGGANLDACDDKRNTPLNSAAMHCGEGFITGRYNFMGSDDSDQPHDIASGHSIVTMLIDAGADLDTRNSFGNTPLHSAINDCNANIIRPLIDAGAKLETLNGAGDTPLNNASKRGFGNIVDLLIDADAEVTLGVYKWP